MQKITEPITYKEVQELVVRLEASADWIQRGISPKVPSLTYQDFRRLKTILEAAAHLWAESDPEG